MEEVLGLENALTAIDAGGDGDEDEIDEVALFGDEEDKAFQHIITK